MQIIEAVISFQVISLRAANRKVQDFFTLSLSIFYFFTQTIQLCIQNQDTTFGIKKTKQLYFFLLLPDQASPVA